MRTRTVLAGATFMTLGLGATAFAQTQLRGSDTLEDVTKDAITAAGIVNTIYAGGGSGAGENALIAGTQHVAPMSRQLNSGTADSAKCITGQAQQLLIGLDGLAIVAANQTTGDSIDESPSTTDNCSDTISGGTTLTNIFKADGVTPCDATDGCSPNGSYTFSSWKDVLAIVYGGQNHNKGSTVNVNAPTFSAAGGACVYQNPPNEAAADAACPAGQVCFPSGANTATGTASGKCGDPAVVGKRNPAIVNCMNPVRLALVDNWGKLFQDVGTANSCRTGTCTKLRHAFRRDDLSGTTDTFDTLVGLLTIADPTRAFANNSPLVDRRAIASPFCNAGDRPMNKGDSDYLDLDPIRRAVDHAQVNEGGANNRYGQEQVAELFQSFGGNNTDANCMRDIDAATAGVQPPIPQDHGSTTEPGVWPDPNIANSQASLMADLGYNAAAGAPDFVLPGLLAANAPAATTRECLGLVLPITLPANYNTVQQAYFADAAGSTVFCDQTDPVTGAVATDSVNMDTQHTGTALCPNGTKQPCDLPYKFDPSVAGNHNFNCMQQKLNPNNSGVQDMRAFNLHPIDSAGHYVRDNFINPNIPTASLSAARQARVVSAYFRIHMTRATDKNGSIPTIGKTPSTPFGDPLCRQFTSTDQLGCVVKANACDISFAGREAVDDLVTLGQANIKNFAFQIEGIRPTTSNVQNLVLPPATPIYPIARTLWLNSIVGFGSASLTADELTLFNFEKVPANIDGIVTNRNFIVVPGGVTNRLKDCPASFP